jgi:para-aminobenzoate synthetase component 1
MMASAHSPLTVVDAGRLIDEINEIATSARLELLWDHWVDPEIAFVEMFSADRQTAWLDAGFGSETGWSYLCAMGAGGYLLTADPSLGVVKVQHVVTSREAEFAGSLFDVMDRVASGTDSNGQAVGSDEGFSLGWVGWIGYESGASAAGAPYAKLDRPDSALLFVDRLIAFDHERRRVVLRAFAGVDAQNWLDETQSRLARLCATGNAEITPTEEPLLLASLRHSTHEYLSLITQCQAQIADGEAYQLCLTNEISVLANHDALQVYRRLRRINPSPRGGLIRAGGIALASSSPELFLRVSSTGLLETRPIKGTRPRGGDLAADVRLKDELIRSDKERAENLMIVDLMRNDFTRVAELGSVQVPELFKVETYSNVFQLVSTVTAQLAPGKTSVAAIRSAFPAGSMTGAPKIRAMTILSALESGPRGAYAGTFGFISVSGAVELSMTIRTIVIDELRGIATIGTGGGITALSVPQDEVEEMLLKAQPMLTALGSRIDEGDSAHE